MPQVASAGSHVPPEPVLPVDGAAALVAEVRAPEAGAALGLDTRQLAAKALPAIGPAAGEEPARAPHGVAVLPGRTPAATRVFVCDTWNHRVQVLDGDGRVMFVFGAEGRHEAQFEQPSDVAIVRPRFGGEPADAGSDLLIAVADTGNGRIQVFEPDGAFVAAFGTPEPPRPGAPSGFTRDGWPFFRSGAHPYLPAPTRLAWRRPHLEITCAEGRVVRVDLALALLPDFERWRHGAAVPLLRAARVAVARSGAPDLAPRVLARIETDLGRAWLAHRLVGSVARLWGRAWPAGLDAAATEQHIEERLHIAAVHRSRMARETGATGEELTIVLHALGQRVAEVRRARSRAASVRELAWQRAQARGDGRRGTPPARWRGRVAEARGRLARATRLAHTAQQLAGARRTQGHIVWTALSGRGGLQQAAASRHRIAVASADGRCLFTLDRCGTPFGELPLPDAVRPVAVAPHPEGGWLVCDAADDRLLWIDARGAVRRTWGTRGSGPRAFRGISGIAASADLVFVCDRDNGRIQVRDLRGDLIGSIRYLEAPVSVAIDGDTLLVSEWRRAQVRRIRRSDGMPVGVFAHPDMVAPAQVVRAAEGSVLVADRVAGAVFAFSHDGRWHGTLTAADGLQLGRPTGLVLTDRRHGLVFEEQHGRAVRFDVPTRERGWWLA